MLTPPMNPAHPWIRTPEEVTRLVAALADCRALALDSESDSLHHHFEKVCLVQLATDRGDAWLIDPLAPGVGPALQALAPVLADPRVVKVFHGADYDVSTLKRDFGFAFAGLFDTMIAARFLGRAAYGLQALAQSELGVALSKGSQKDDWSRRPLSAKQEAYALADVEHLLALAQRLIGELRERGRASWVREECETLAELPAARRRQDPDAYQKIKGARELTPPQLAVLRELHAWREARAEATDTPPFKTLGNQTMLDLAMTPPRTEEELQRVPEVLPRHRSRVGQILEAVARGLAVVEAELPQRARTPWPTVPRATRRRVDALKDWRAEEAARAGLEASVVLPQRLIDRLAEAAPTTLADLAAIDGLRRWRIDAFGPALLRAIIGSAAPLP